MIIPDYIKIENRPGLCRHTKSMGVVNHDKQARSQYITQREKILNDQQVIEQLKTDVSELKILVQQLLNHK